MTRPLVTATRRGLVLTFYSEVPLVLGLLAFLLLPSHSTTYLLLGIGGSLLLGAPAGLSVWAGRNEFGARHGRNVRRGLFTFGLLGLSLLLAYGQIDAMQSQTLRVRDLWAPWFFLGVAIVADALAMVCLVAGLVLERGRRWIQAILVLSALAAVGFLAIGGVAVADLVARSGGVAANPAEAASYARDFILRVVRPFALGLLVLRLGFWPSLYWAATAVAEAEREAEAARQEGWSASAPPF